jgi:hypothetical protein
MGNDRDSSWAHQLSPRDREHFTKIRLKASAKVLGQSTADGF